MASLVELCILLVCLCSTAHSVYQDDSDPWKPGPLATEEILIEMDEDDPDGIPMHTRVYLPTEVEEDLAIVYFVGGFDGMFPTEIYGDLMHDMASHGYVLAGTWALQGEDGYNSSYAAHLSNLEWLKDNLDDYIDASVSWDHLSYACHSGGCGSTYEMTKDDPEQIVSNVFFEPVSMQIHAGENCVKPAIMMGALLATGRCSLEAMDHKVYYSYWECPRLLLEAEEFGHCDLLNEEAWTLCNVSGFCVCGPEERLQEYQDFVQGMAAAFLNTYAQGQPHYLDYLLVEEDIPIKLSIYETDTECLESSATVADEVPM